MADDVTPLFHSIFYGSLRGRYPDLVVFMVLLGMKDSRGVITATPQHIAEVSGVPLAHVELAIARFLAPDLNSRTKDFEGRRLQPLDDGTAGWYVINHRKYKEKARKQQFDKRRVESGEDKRRKAVERNQTTERPVSRACPALVPRNEFPDVDLSRAEELSSENFNLTSENFASTLTDSKNKSQKENRNKTPESGEESDTELGGRESAREREPSPTLSRAIVPRFVPRFLSPRPLRRAPAAFVPDRAFALREIPDLDIDREISRFRDCEFRTPRRDWSACWRNWIRTCRDSGHYAKRGAIISNGAIDPREWR